MIWNEWLDEMRAVLNLNVLLNLVFELKFLDVFMGREDPIEFDMLICLFICSLFYF